MSKEISYTQARDNLARYMDQAVESHEVIKIRRKTTGGGIQEVALIDADDLESLMETAYLLRSPKNAERLFNALNRSLAQTGTPKTVEELEREFGIHSQETAGEAAEDSPGEADDAPTFK